MDDAGFCGKTGTYGIRTSGGSAAAVRDSVHTVALGSDDDAQSSRDELRPCVRGGVVLRMAHLRCRQRRAGSCSRPPKCTCVLGIDLARQHMSSVPYYGPCWFQSVGESSSSSSSSSSSWSRGWRSSFKSCRHAGLIQTSAHTGRSTLRTNCPAASILEQRVCRAGRHHRAVPYCMFPERLGFRFHNTPSGK